MLTRSTRPVRMTKAHTRERRGKTGVSPIASRRRYATSRTPRDDTAFVSRTRRTGPRASDHLLSVTTHGTRTPRTPHRPGGFDKPLTRQRTNGWLHSARGAPPAPRRLQHLTQGGEHYNRNLSGRPDRTPLTPLAWPTAPRALLPPSPPGLARNSVAEGPSARPRRPRRLTSLPGPRSTLSSSSEALSFISSLTHTHVPAPCAARPASAPSPPRPAPHSAFTGPSWDRHHGGNRVARTGRAFSGLQSSTNWVGHRSRPGDTVIAAERACAVRAAKRPRTAG